jgi:hypothetical protein
MLHSLDVGRGDIGSTVRRGFKWADLKWGETILLCVCTRDPETHDVQGSGKVTEVWVGQFADIPARYLEFEHETQSRLYSGLLESMEHAYGEDFDELEYVTVLTYRRDA